VKRSNTLDLSDAFFVCYPQLGATPSVIQIPGYCIAQSWRVCLYLSITRLTVAYGAQSLTLNSYNDVGNESMEKNTYEYA